MECVLKSATVRISYRVDAMVEDVRADGGHLSGQRPDVRYQRSVITPLRRSRDGEGASAR
jgi:hypothetical protein